MATILGLRSAIVLYHMHLLTIMHDSLVMAQKLDEKNLLKVWQKAYDVSLLPIHLPSLHRHYIKNSCCLTW
jgi:hypothetical protein